MLCAVSCRYINAFVTTLWRYPPLQRTISRLSNQMLQQHKSPLSNPETSQLLQKEIGGQYQKYREHLRRWWRRFLAVPLVVHLWHKCTPTSTTQAFWSRFWIQRFGVWLWHRKFVEVPTFLAQWYMARWSTFTCPHRTFRLDSSGRVVRASHGTRQLAGDELRGVYPADSYYKNFANVRVFKRDEAFIYFTTYFDIPAALLCARLVDAIDSDGHPGHIKKYECGSSCVYIHMCA